MAQPPLLNKVVAITGGASGIGLATARECAIRGCSALALADLNASALEAAVSGLKSQFPNVSVTGTQVNVTNSEAVDAWIQSIVAEYGRLDCAANIAGVEGKPGASPYSGIAEMSDEQWQFLIDVNLTGVFKCLRAQLRVMKEGGSIVNAASVAGLRGTARFSAYTSSKHGVVGLTKSAAKEAGVNGIRVNAVCPGAIDTDLLRRMLTGDDAFLDMIKNQSPMKRLGKIEEVAKTFCYLLGDESSWTSGTTLTLDGAAS